MIALKIPKVRLLDEARASIFSCQRFISVKTVVHISFAVKGVFPKDLNLCFTKYGSSTFRAIHMQVLRFLTVSTLSL